MGRKGDKRRGEGVAVITSLSLLLESILSGGVVSSSSSAEAAALRANESRDDGRRGRQWKSSRGRRSREPMKGKRSS